MSGVPLYSQIYILGLQYKSFSFGADTSPGESKLVSPNTLE